MWVHLCYHIRNNFDYIAHNYVLGGSVFIELFMIYYASIFR